MNWSPARRRWIIVLSIVALLLVAAWVALQVALRRLPRLVANALGPRASVGRIEAGWRGVEIHDLVIQAEADRWPVAQELRADRVTVLPAWSSLWGGPWRVSRIEVDGGYLSMLRTREGRLAVVPALLGRRGLGGAGTASAPTASFVRLDAVSLRHVTLDLFDATVSGPRGGPHQVRLSELRADVGPIALPALDAPMDVDLASVFKGVHRDGHLSVKGRLTPATREAALAIRAQDVDLLALQPYILRRGEGAIERGTLDLSVDAKASQQRLHAPGHVRLQGLELASGQGLLGTFGGVPRQAVLAAMSRDGRIDLDFTLEGKLDDPRFSFNEVFAAKFALGLAEKLGVSLGGAVEGVANVIKGLLGR